MSKPLEPILILSYFFPPCNLTAAQRTLGFATYLHQFGYYPIVITRNWERKISSPDDMHHNSGSTVIHEKNDNYEVYYLPYKGNLRDRLYAKYGNEKWIYLRKFLSLIELTGQHFYTDFIPFSNLYHFADEYLSKTPAVKKIIVSGNPFEIFRFGYKLSRKHAISWIADYRDDWNTTEIVESRGLFATWLKKLNIWSEKRYMKTAFCITSISPFYARKIGEFNSRPSEVVLNGYFPSDYQHFQQLKLYTEFSIVYNGMLYASQRIEVFLDAFKQFVDEHPEHRSKIRLRFPGILFLEEVAKRVEELLKGYEDVLELLPRIPREKVLEMQAKSHVLLMVSHGETKGIPSSKIYEYLGLGKPVLVCPTDHDILHETFASYNLGKIAEHSEEALKYLNEWFSLFLSNEYESLRPDRNYIQQFTRDHQAGVLAQILNRIH